MRINFTFTFIVTFLLLSNYVPAQDYTINKVFKKYFPVNPYKYRFSIFYQKLNTNPAITNKYIQKRTDSTLFSFKGGLNNYEFGDFLFTEAEVRLEEIQVKIPGHDLTDTLMQYQVTCFCTGGQEGLEIAKKAFLYFDDNLSMLNGQVKTKVEEGRLTGLMQDYT